MGSTPCCGWDLVLIGCAHGRDAEAAEQFNVNFYGPLRLMRAALPGFRKRKVGTIVNVSSVAAIDALPSCGLYSASKFALEGENGSLWLHQSSG